MTEAGLTTPLSDFACIHVGFLFLYLLHVATVCDVMVHGVAVTDSVFAKALRPECKPGGFKHMISVVTSGLFESMLNVHVKIATIR